MIASIERGITLPMGRVIQDYLINHRLCPHQCAPNLFRVLGSIDTFNEQMGLRLTWHVVVHMYKCHLLANSGSYLKSRSSIVRLISCFPKSNKGMKDNYLIASKEWHDGLHYPTREGEPSRVPQVRSLGMGFSSFRFATLPFNIFFSFDDGFYWSDHDLLLSYFCR